MVAEKTLRGSCLCGRVKYQITGETQRFYHCHCSRCRKASGTGHASNLLMAADGIQWLGDGALRGAWKVPEAERFQNDFCRNCGSPLPRYLAARGVAVIPAGTLDDDPGIAPQARIFFDSRSSWSCDVDSDLPRFSEYPD